MYLRIIILKLSIVRREKMRRKLYGQQRKRKMDKEEEEKIGDGKYLVSRGEKNREEREGNFFENENNWSVEG